MAMSDQEKEKQEKIMEESLVATAAAVGAVFGPVFAAPMWKPIVLRHAGHPILEAAFF